MAQQDPWDAPVARPFAQTPAFLALAVVLVLAAGGLGVYLGGRGGGSDTAASGSAGGAGTPAAALQARLPAKTFRDCAAGDAQEGQDAALTCAPVSKGADQLLVRHFADAGAMARDFEARYKSTYDDGKCGSFPGGDKAAGTGVVSTWDSGVLACYVNSNGDATLLWEYPAEAVQIIAVRTDADFPALFAWWLAADKTLA